MKVLFFIGSRANLSSALPIMEELENNDAFSLQVVLSNSAVLDKYGEAESQLQFVPDQRIVKLNNVIMGDIPSTMSKTFALTAADCTLLFEQIKPDWLFIVGDRYEMLAATVTASLMNIRVAHSMGGEVTGTIDESIRHAITKLAHIHFTANDDAYHRVISMGEQPEYVYNTGCPRIDFVSNTIKRSAKTAAQILKSHDGIGEINVSNGYLLVSQHSVTTEFEGQSEAIKATLDAISNIPLPKVLLWPNVDSGSDVISREIRIRREKHMMTDTHLVSNLPASDYTILLNECSCLVGNSSSGVREAAFLGTPVVNIGSRQAGRLRGKNVIDVGHDAHDIANAIRKQVKNGKFASEDLYGSGNASKTICERLLNDIPSVQKRIVY